MKIIEDVALPPLRSDIQLNEGPPENEGEPTWTLYDPAANKYYKIGWFEFECLNRFKNCHSVLQLIAQLKAETTLQPDEDEIKALVNFLIHHNLVLSAGETIPSYFETLRKKAKKHWWEKVLHGYLFFIIPIFKPQAFLNKTYPYIKFLFTRQFLSGILLLLLYGIFLTLQRFDEFSTTFMHYLSFEGVLLFLVATIFVKTIHEMGHAFMATKYGVPVPVMGIAFIVMYPVLYSETTNVWRLYSRRDRLNIAAAGVMAEIVLAAVALVLWHILSPGYMQSLCFMIATVSLVASLAININPLMRFDGYYLFSDFFGFDNMQDRAFAFSKWKLRRFLWRWDDDPPESLPEKRQNILTAFGFAIWVYRFFLYSGIAFLVYHLFFQPLGLLLMLVELGFFIAFPIFREISVWWVRAADISVFTKGGFLGICIVFMFILSFIPIHRSIEIPAILHAASYTRIYAPVPARIDEIMVAQDQKVEKDQLIFKLSSPHLNYNIAIVSKRLSALQDIRDSSQASVDLSKKRATIGSEIEQAKKELEGFLTIKDQLNIKAPYAGTIKDFDQSLHAGQWIGKNHTLGLLVDNTELILDGYVREQDRSRVAMGGRGFFYPEFSPFSRYAVVLDHLDQTSVSEIYWPELSSVYSGPVPAERSSGGGIRALPRFTLYMAHLKFEDSGHNHDLPGFVARGVVRLDAAPSSISNTLIKKAVSVVVREGGF